VKIRHEAMRLPPGAEIVKISPEYLSLRLEKRLRRAIPVTPRVAGEPVTGHAFAGARVEPVQVEVEGPESAVRLSREVLTDTVRIAGRAERFDVMVNLYPDRAGVKILHEGMALLTVDIQPATAPK
jgi:hypothetical protein